MDGDARPRVNRASATHLAMLLQVAILTVCGGEADLDSASLPESDAVIVRGQVRMKLDTRKLMSVETLIAAYWPRQPRWLQTHKGKDTQVAVRNRTHCDIRGGPLGPAIIGGIGDSGTRGAAQMLAEGFGFEMCPKPNRCNKARDNTVMFKLLGNKVRAVVMG